MRSWVESTFPRLRASWLASERRIALWAISEQPQGAGFLPEPAVMVLVHKSYKKSYINGLAKMAISRISKNLSSLADLCTNAETVSSRGLPSAPASPDLLGGGFHNYH